MLPARAFSGKENGVTKRELVVAISDDLGYTQNEVANVVQTTLDTIIECLADGQRLEVRNFGVFEVKERDARMGRNPRTGDEVPITRKRVATFKPGKALKEIVQNGTTQSGDGNTGQQPSSPGPQTEQNVENPSSGLAF